jgi:hypothetical protein
MLFSCNVKKTGSVPAQDNPIGSVEGARGNASPRDLTEEAVQDVTGGFVDEASDTGKRGGTDFFELKWVGTINPDDITRMGISELTSIEQLLAVLPDEQVKEIERINFWTPVNIKSFKGIERFTRLQTLSIRKPSIEDRKSSIEDLEDLVLPHNNLVYVYFEDSEIGSLKGLDGIGDMLFLSLAGSHIKDKDSIELVGKLNSLKSISLDRFPDYKKALDILPETITTISINNNGINTIKEIEFLKEKEKYPYLKYVYVGGNNFSWEDLETEQPNWLPVELEWVESGL